MPGGKRPGAGRPPGAKNKRTVEREEKQAEVLETLSKLLGLDAFEGDAVAFFQLLYKSPGTPLDLKFEAAKQAAPYERPKLQATEAVQPGTLVKSHEEALAELERGPPDEPEGT